MHYTEELLWILDKKDKLRGTEEALYQRNIDFVHSLGLKCDCVGWCRLDMARPDTGEILDAIGEFCRNDGWKARGYYTRTLVDEEPQWYELKPANFREAAFSTNEKVPGVHGDVYLPTLKAFHETSPGPKEGFGTVYMPDRFRRALAEMPDVDFCWLRDKGRYEAEQYFAMFPQRMVPCFGVGDHALKEEKPLQFLRSRKERELMEAIGGWSPRVGELFYDLYVEQPKCYLASQLPQGGVVWAYHREKHNPEAATLLHRDLAKALVEARVLLPRDLRPALVVEALGPGYQLLQGTPAPRPTQGYLRKTQAEYEAFCKVSRPKRQVTEKQALTQLRRAKRDRPEDFRKPLPKAKAEALTGTPWEPLAAYYRITDGGYLNEDYALLAQKDWEGENAEFQAALQKEELEEHLPQGVKFGTTPGGDTLLLCSDGTVVTFGHEAPVILDQWPNLAQFVFDLLTEVGG